MVGGQSDVAGVANNVTREKKASGRCQDVQATALELQRLVILR